MPRVVPCETDEHQHVRRAREQLTYMLADLAGGAGRAPRCIKWVWSGVAG